MSSPPAYRRIADDIRAQIVAGTLQPGDALPSASRLKADYGVSSTVVRDAISELRHAGLVVGQQGRGVYVQQVPGPAEVRTLDGLREVGARVQLAERALDEARRRRDEAIHSVRRLTQHTIAEIAEAAGCSEATVKAVVRGLR